MGDKSILAAVTEGPGAAVPKCSALQEELVKHGRPASPPSPTLLSLTSLCLFSSFCPLSFPLPLSRPTQGTSRGVGVPLIRSLLAPVSVAGVSLKASVLGRTR